MLLINEEYHYVYSKIVYAFITLWRSYLREIIICWLLFLLIYWPIIEIIHSILAFLNSSSKWCHLNGGQDEGRMSLVLLCFDGEMENMVVKNLSIFYVRICYGVHTTFSWFFWYLSRNGKSLQSKSERTLLLIRLNKIIYMISIYKKYQLCNYNTSIHK